MDEKNKIQPSEEDLREAFEGKSKSRKTKTKKPFSKKQFLIFLITGCVSLIVGIVLFVVALLTPAKEQIGLDYPTIPSTSDETIQYSALTGEVLAKEASATAPAYCIQTPNGTDGARPQAGLNQAGVIFEAIAEAGITRFAAIYQDPSTAIIGPIRSLRLYYLEWDAPFNCTIVHAGGADDAIAAVAAGGYKDLNESYQYMYRGTYNARRWNNLFTTSALLKEYSKENNSSSEIKGFSRLTPQESDEELARSSTTEQLVITKPAEGNTSEMEVSVPKISLFFGGLANFNVEYNYDTKTNTYLRSYASGNSHEVYDCPKEDLGEKNPEDVCTLTQMAPSVVVAMVVNERKASDNYHEDITTIGSGDAFIFQNGTAIKGSWKKDTRNDQIKFRDEDGKEIKLAPGQTFISAIPNYGRVEY